MYLFKITLNWYGEIHIFYTHAKAETIAIRNSRKRLKIKLGKTPKSTELYYYFRGHKDNVKVEKLS